jgi:hypothetical protein
MGGWNNVTFVAIKKRAYKGNSDFPALYRIYFELNLLYILKS